MLTETINLCPLYRSLLAACPARDSVQAKASNPRVDELAMRCTVSAPAARVFDYWINPAHIARWWSPCAVEANRSSVIAKPGGAYQVCIRTYDNTEHWLRGVYRVVTAPELLSFTWAWENETAESLVTVRFEPQGDKTLVLLRQTGFTTEGARTAHAAGWEECFERLLALLADHNAENDEVQSC